MLHVDLNNILSEEQAANQLNDLLKRADEGNQLIVVTRNGKPAVAILGVAQLEELSGHAVQAPSPTVSAPVASMTPPVSPATPVMPVPSSSGPSSDLPPLQPTEPSALPDMPDLV